MGCCDVEWVCEAISFGDARGPRACPPLMPQGLDVTLWMIRGVFWLVKPKTQDIWPQQGVNPYIWVDYLWISLLRSWAQAGYWLGETGQKRAPTCEARRRLRQV